MRLRRVHAFILVLGFVLMIYLLWRVGFQNIWGKLSLLGSGLIVLIWAEGVAEFFHAISWRYCLGDAHRGISLSRLFGMNVAGYAISYLTPTASVGGDVTRTVLLIGSGKGVDAVSSMLVSKLSFAIAHLSFVLVGCILIVPRITLPASLRLSLLIGCFVLMCGILTFLWIQKRGKLGILARYLVRRKVGGDALAGLLGYISRVDDALQSFYRARPSGLPLAVFWHLIGYLVGIFQVWYFLYIVAGSPLIVPSIKVWFVGMWFDLLTFAIPMNLGALEGGRIMAFSSVGYDPSVGIAFAVAMRIVQLSMSALGLVIYLLLVSKKYPGRKSGSERLAERKVHEGA